jgi:hypothetical protein
MLTAADFIDLDYSKTNSLKERRVLLFSSIEILPRETKLRLVTEFLEIATASNEKLTRRVQAAKMLAVDGQKFGIEKGAYFAGELAAVIDNEYLLTPRSGSRESVDLALRRMRGMRLFFFNFLESAIYQLDHVKWHELASRILEIADEGPAALRIKERLKNS